MENVESTSTDVRRPFAEALAEFPAEYRDVVHEFACGDDADWNRRFTVSYSPALALQLAIDPTLKHARWLLDEHYPFDGVAAAARLAVPRHTRPAHLCVVGRNVRLVKTTKMETAN